VAHFATSNRWPKGLLTAGFSIASLALLRSSILETMLEESARTLSGNDGCH
jgi:hypothetical protein